LAFSRLTLEEDAEKGGESAPMKGEKKYWVGHEGRGGGGQGRLLFKKEGLRRKWAHLGKEVYCLPEGKGGKGRKVSSIPNREKGIDFTLKGETCRLICFNLRKGKGGREEKQINNRGGIIKTKR